MTEYLETFQDKMVNVVTQDGRVIVVRNPTPNPKKAYPAPLNISNLGNTVYQSVAVLDFVVAHVHSVAPCE